MKPRILTLNAGSSSLKFSIYEIDRDAEKCLLSGKFDRTSASQSHFHAANDEGVLADESTSEIELKPMVALLFERLSSFQVGSIDAIGHRIVQGGPHHMGPELVTPSLVSELQTLSPLDPPHLAASLDGIAAAREWNKSIPQIACFDTSFHRSLPPVAQTLPLPRELTQKTGLMRYGFHGLSYEYILSDLISVAGPGPANGKVIIAHLGNGASMAAVLNGKSLETTMGFTPAGGLVMSSRTGDLDPGVIAYLLREGKVAPENLSEFIFQKCGLKGVSGFSSDMRDLMRTCQTDPHAQLALDLFCYQARKAVGSLVAVLDGLETLVFTGGVGENAALPRALICEGLHHLGLRLDHSRNERHESIISDPDSSVTVRVMKTNEEVIIARHAARLAFPPPSQTQS